MANPISESALRGMGWAVGKPGGMELTMGDPAGTGIGGVLHDVLTADAGFQGAPEDYEIWLGQQYQDLHDQVWMSDDLKADGDSMGDLKPGFWKETSSTIYTEVPLDQAPIIVEGNGPSRTVTVRGILYSVLWTGTEYSLTQTRIL